MSVNEFYTEILKLLPYKEEREHPFRRRLKNCLEKYKQLVKELEINGVRIDGGTIELISDNCKKINDIVDNSMKGKPSTAFIQLRNLLDRHAGNQKINLDDTLLTINPNTDFYRVRRMNTVCEKTRKELFHIPIPERGMVKTQRYSSPGYPCLYLGNSIYGCWEEMRRPHMHECAVSRFRSETALNFIDITIPSKERIGNVSILKRMPLVIACMIRVADDDATYKPEYIVPQLLIEWILKFRHYKENNEKKCIHGVVYHSTHMNSEFKFPTDKLINYAIPVFSVDSGKRYCPTLCEAFSLTEPTTDEVEKLKGDYPIHLWTEVSDHNEQLDMNYNSSAFGTLEYWLREGDKFPTGRICYKDGKDLSNL